MIQGKQTNLYTFKKHEAISHPNSYRSGEGTLLNYSAYLKTRK